MSTLIELFNELPDDMILRSHVNSEQKTVKEWKAKHGKPQPGDDKYLMHDSEMHYGRVSYKVIYWPGAGQIFSEVKKG